MRIGAGGEGKFADERAAEFEKLLGELAIFARVDDVDSGAEDGDGASARHDGSLVGHGIDAAGEAADDDESTVGKVLGKTLGHAEAVRGGMAGADDGDGGLKQDAGIAAHVEDERGIVDFGKVFGIKTRSPWLTSVTPGTVASFFSSSSARRSELPSAMDWALAAGRPVASSSVSEARKMSSTLGNVLKETADTGGAKLRGEGECEHLAVARGDLRNGCFGHKTSMKGSVAECGAGSHGKMLAETRRLARGVGDLQS